MSDDPESPEIKEPVTDLVAPPSSEVACYYCATLFTPSPSTFDHPGFCSRKCQRQWWRRSKRVTNTSKEKQSTLPENLLRTDALSPDEVEALRGRVAQHVANQIEMANEVVLGIRDREWTATQARLFQTMLNKVIPDVRAEAPNKDLPINKDLTTLSRSDLERLAVTAISRNVSATASVDPDDPGPDVRPSGIPGLSPQGGVKQTKETK